MRLVAFGLVVFLAWRLHELWRDNAADLTGANAPLLVLAAACSLAAVVAYGAVWPVILRRIGATVPRDSVRIFLQSQLAKYIPGSVWQYAGRVGLAKTRGVPARLTMISLGIEVAASMAAAAIVGLFVLPWQAAVSLALGLVAGVLWLARGKLTGRLASAASSTIGRLVPLAPEDLAAALRTAPRIAALYVPVWAAHGIAFWLTARALFPVPASDLVYFVATFALGWLAGMVAVFAPGGIGVREVVFVGLLGPRIGHVDALVVAGVSRIILVGADLLCGGTSVLLFRTRGGGVQTVTDRPT